MKSWDLGQEFDKKQIAVTAQFLADSLAENIEKRRGRGLWACQHRGNCRPLIEAKPRVQEMWVRKLALTSGQVTGSVHLYCTLVLYYTPVLYTSSVNLYLTLVLYTYVHYIVIEGM